MSSNIVVGLIGDFDPSVPAHRAIPPALQLAADALHVEVDFEWVSTEEITSPARLARFAGLWCVPASPYRSMDGALLAIRHAREHAIPFLGTCGGFQHAVVEYARNVLGWADAEHAETAPLAARAVVSALECALVETTGVVRLFPGTRIAAAYGSNESSEGYRCRYGLNPEFQAALVAGPLRASADDETGAVRAVELDGHPFFVATLFQPERAALQDKTPALVAAFVRACARGRPTTRASASPSAIPALACEDESRCEASTGITTEPDPQGPALRRFRDPDYLPLCNTLAEVRAGIDAIDEQLVKLLAERGRYVRDAARFKRDAFQVSAPQRQQQVIDKVARLAAEHGAYPEVVEACWRAMIAGFVAREQTDHQDMIDIENEETNK